MSRVNLNDTDLKNLIVNILTAEKWQVRNENNKLIVSTNNLVGTEFDCSVIDLTNKTVTLESHKSWNSVAWKSIDPIRGAIGDFEILYKNL